MTIERLRTDSNSVSLKFTADGAGAFTATTIAPPAQRVGLASVAIVYGGTAPDALAVTVKDSDAIDLLAGLGATITATTRIDVVPPAIFSGGLTVALTGNSTAGAIVTIKLYFI